MIYTLEYIIEGDCRGGGGGWGLVGINEGQGLENYSKLHKRGGRYRGGVVESS